ncbi:centromere protein T [Girardinichthys multiradiatus]|uniref:centromere protein T n=1 Tax=Girardinichthys multiradiatus TaxID=208333 RepID=UPI001FABA34C|nr:centromere protein T [Girardinichthys multiradiatus]
MDPTEDLSARILLKNILSTEPPRTPLSRSASQEPSGSGLRRSSRFRRKDAEPQTPQIILRRSLRHNLHESITRKIPPATKRRTASVLLRRQTASTSMVFNDEETPRHLLRNILQTEPLKSPVVHEKVTPEELQPPSADNAVNRTRSSIELSGHDLFDVTVGNVVSTKKGLSRKRPHRSLNVSAFEKRLKDDQYAEEISKDSVGDLSSLSLSSSTSLTLKTPFVDVRSEKRGFQRHVSRHRKFTEEFNAALNKQQMGDVSGPRLQEQNLGEDTHFEGITLGLSEPDITVDIMNCHTALYDQEDAINSNLSIIATQDKPTVMASQLQRHMQEIKEQEEEQSKMQREKPEAVLFSEDNDVTDPENDGVSDSRGKKDVDETKPGDTEADDHPDDHQDSAASLKSKEKEDAVASQTFDLDVRVESEEPEAQTEEEVAADSQSEQDEDAVGPQEEDEGVNRFEIEEKVAADPQSEQDEAAVGPQNEDVGSGRSRKGDEDMEQSQTEEEGDLPETEKAAADSQPEDSVAASQSEEEKIAGASQTEDEGGSESQAEKLTVNKSQGNVVEEFQAEEDAADCQTDEDHNEDEKDHEEEWGSEVLERNVGHISRRAYRSEGGLLLPVIKAREDPTDTTTAGLSYTKSKGHSALGLNTSLEINQSQTGKPDRPKPPFQDHEDDVWLENDPVDRKNTLFDLLRVSREAQVCGQQSDIPLEAPAEQEEEGDEDNDYEEFSSKTPAFVREKRNFTSDPQPSPLVIKKVQASSTSEALSTAKPKQVRRRKPRRSKKEAVLPKTYLMGVFKHFAKTKVSADVFPVLNEIMDKFFARLAEDLETYAAHAKRKTIEVEDVKLLLRRQGYINDKVPVEVLIEKYLRMEQRKILIPVATSGNVVIPKIRK